MYDHHNLVDQISPTNGKLSLKGYLISELNLLVRRDAIPEAVAAEAEDSDAFRITSEERKHKKTKSPRYTNKPGMLTHLDVAENYTNGKCLRFISEMYKKVTG